MWKEVYCIQGYMQKEVYCIYVMFCIYVFSEYGYKYVFDVNICNFNV